MAECIFERGGTGRQQQCGENTHTRRPRAAVVTFMPRTKKWGSGLISVAGPGATWAKQSPPPPPDVAMSAAASFIGPSVA